MLILEKSILQKWFKNESLDRFLYVAFNFPTKEILISPRKILWTEELVINKKFKLGSVGNCQCITIPQIALDYWTANGFIKDDMVDVTIHTLGLFIRPVSDENIIDFKEKQSLKNFWREGSED